MIESIIGGIIILLTPAPTINSFRAWKPPLCHKDTVKGKKCPYYRAGVVGLDESPTHISLHGDDPSIHGTDHGLAEYLVVGVPGPVT